MALNNENRIHRRVQAGFETEVILPNGNCLHVTTSNLSLNGVMINATHQDFEMMLGTKKNLDLSVEVDLKFKLSNKNADPILVSCHCRTVYIRRVAQDRYVMGFKFLKINQGFESAIQKFIHDHPDQIVS